MYDGFVASDVIIAGGGIIGCSIAWRLAQRGLKVKVLDSGRIGHEASRAGAGMLAPGGEAGPESPWARHMVASLAMYPAFIEELKAASGLPIEFQICGAHEYGCDELDWPGVLERAEKQRLLGIQSTVEENRLFYPNDGQVKPSHVIRAIDRGGRQDHCRISWGIRASSPSNRTA